MTASRLSISPKPKGAAKPLHRKGRGLNKAVRTFRQDSPLTLTFYQFDTRLYRHIRTTKQLERLFREFRTQADEIGAFPHETSCLTSFWRVVERNHAKHDRKSSANNS